MMRKHAKRFGGMLSVLLVLAAAFVVGTGSAASAAEFGLHYTSSAGQEGYATSAVGVTTEVLVLKEMFLGERVDFLASDDCNAGLWAQSWRLESLVEDKVKYASGGGGIGKAFFPNTAKSGEVGNLLLWVASATLNPADVTSFDLKGIVAKSPVQVHLYKAAVTIDTAAASRDEIVVS